MLVEIARGTLTRVSVDGDVDVVAELKGGPNGAAVGPDGKIYVCNNGGFVWNEVNGMTVPGLQPDNYTGGKIQRVDIETGEIETLYDEIDGLMLRGPERHRLRQQRRVLVHRPRQGAGSSAGPWRPLLRQGRWLGNPRGRIPTRRSKRCRPVARRRHSVCGRDPPGSSPSMAAVRSGRDRRILRPGTSRHHSLRPEGGPLFDSLAVDSLGNICVATIRNGGITIITPDGAHRHVPFDDPITTNICFGGPNLQTAFVTLSGSGRLVSRRWEVGGLPLAFDRSWP